MMGVEFKIRARALGRFFRVADNVFRAVTYSLLILFVLQWLFALPLLTEVISQSGFANVFRFMVDGFIEFLRLSTGDYIPVALILVSLLQGTTVAVVRALSKRTVNKPSLYKTAALALFGSGCVACGGSVIAPFLSSFSTAAAASVSVRISMFILTISIVLAGISLWQVLGWLATIQAKDKHEKTR